ncbi:LysM peptidoglycan-binding domain-containing protein [Williamsia sp.]|uniref:LysM peptidoglycan-binding domain-containing protein n=1 Tax=Williamsia sp. TaxID=1872085 RepID=UPI002F9597C3
MAKKYKVVSGDTLSALAKRFYGDADLFEVIAIANELPDPDVIRTGQVLLIPGLTKKYKVVAGDTLSELAAKFYGDSSMFPLIAAANQLSDPDFITVGQILRIPDL